MALATITFSQVVLAIHIIAAVAGFGVIFAYPLMFAAAARTDPAVIPWLLRARQRLGRYLVNPGLTVVVLAGIYLASDEHQWSHFYVGWGIVAALALGAIEGAIIIPRSGRLAVVAEQDLAATAVPGGGQRTSATWSRQYIGGSRLLWLGGAALQIIIVVTVFLMATQLG
ncbi:MAG: hypothetical protein WAL63_20060 [Solirubrobacteraceae bacterium]